MPPQNGTEGRSTAPPSPTTKTRRATTRDAPAGSGGGREPLPPPRALVRFFLAATAAVFVISVAILFYRWASVREPTSVLVIEASPRFAGMTITVDGPELRRPYVVTIGSTEDYRLPIFLDRGSYTLRLADGEHELLETLVLLGRREGQRIDLRALEPLLEARAAATRRSAESSVSTP